MTNMMAERTPLAVLASALSDHQAPPGAAPPANSADWWASNARSESGPWRQTQPVWSNFFLPIIF